MPEGGFVNLQPKIELSGDLKFFKAEWWVNDPRFAIVTYSYKNSDEKWVRMDLDKRRFIDQQDDTHLDELIKMQTDCIWKIIIDELESSHSMSD
jgi:hypothetical protein